MKYTSLPQKALGFLASLCLATDTSASAATIISGDDGLFLPSTSETDLTVSVNGSSLTGWTQPTTGAATVLITWPSIPEFLSAYNDDSAIFSCTINLILVNNGTESTLATWATPGGYTLPTFASAWGFGVGDGPILTGPSSPVNWSGTIASDFDIVVRNTSNFGGSSYAFADTYANFEIAYTAVPEPSSALLLTIGSLGLLRRRRKSA